jgi:hypothetical protein
MLIHRVNLIAHLASRHAKIAFLKNSLQIV